MLSVNPDLRTPRVFKRQTHQTHLWVIHCFEHTSPDILILLPNVACGSTAWSSPGSLLEMQNFSLQLSLTDSESLHVSKIPKGYEHTVTFEKCCSTLWEMGFHHLPYFPGFSLIDSEAGQILRIYIFIKITPYNSDYLGRLGKINQHFRNSNGIWTI